MAKVHHVGAALRPGWVAAKDAARSALDTTKHIPSGSLNLDSATFGGAPMGSQWQIIGPFASMKTWLSLQYAAYLLKTFPGMKVVYIHCEPDGINWTYVQQAGIDISENRFVEWPVPSAEEAGMAIIKMMQADDCIMVILDSIASMVTTAADKRNTDKLGTAQNPDRAILMNRIVASVTKVLIQDAMQEKPRRPVMCWINQWRNKIDGYGSPLVAPSAGALEFQSRFSIELNVLPSERSFRKDEALGLDVPCSNDVRFKVRKEHGSKGVEGVFTVNVDPAHSFLRPGQVDEASSILARAVGYKLLTGGAGELRLEVPGFEPRVTTAKTDKGAQDQLLKMVRNDPEFAQAIKDTVIGMHRKANHMSETGWKAGS